MPGLTRHLTPRYVNFVYRLIIASEAQEMVDGSHVMDQAAETGVLDVYRIEGLTGISESAAVQQYMRTGALPFWVAITRNC